MGGTQVLRQGIMCQPTGIPPTRIARVGMFKSGAAMNATFGTPIVVGDLVLCCITSYDGGVHSAPAGWTEIYQNGVSYNGGYTMRTSLWGKFANATDVSHGYVPDAANFSTNAQTSGVGICDVWRGAAMPTVQANNFPNTLMTSDELALPQASQPSAFSRAVAFCARGFGSGPAGTPPFFVGGGIDDLHVQNTGPTGSYASMTTLVNDGSGNTPATPHWDVNGNAGGRVCLISLVIPPA